jgi:cullin-associated NEDD8-dissociated protein 1
VSILKVCPAAGPAVKTHVLEHALSLSTSSLLQDLALESLLALWSQVIESRAVEFQELLGLLRERLTEDTPKAGIYILAKSIATIAAATTTGNTQAFLGDMLNQLEVGMALTEDADVRHVQLALLITGDLGRFVDLGSYGDTAGRLKTAYVRFFESRSDDLKQAAAYALGNASVGCHSVFLKEIVERIDEDNKKQQYLLLSALREFIKSSNGDGISLTLPAIAALLEKHCGDEEEGVRTMVAECMGSLTCLRPVEMLSKLEEVLKSHSSISAPGGTISDDEDSSSKLNARVCWTVATSIKLSIAGKVDPATLTGSMPSFIGLLQQEELNVRTAALLMVYSASHHMPQVLSSLVKDYVMPALFDVAKLKLERKVDLGPFTHTVDDALPLRKAALSIFATCLDNLPGSIEISTFMPVLAASLGDAEDIQLHAHQIVISMCSRQPAYLVASVDAFVEPLGKTMNMKAGPKTGTELERLNDRIKSALRVMIALSKLEGSMHSPKFSDFVERSKRNSKFTEVLQAIGAEL